ncbi:MAG TPA: glycosyltransferase [Campylobacterales bacterium]|nr:glycosyltransferase [Campylobacterales bacterium]
MNIFVIPSWYPTNENQLVGRFFKEQACLYAGEFENDNVIISRWGQGEFIVDISSPLNAAKKLFSFCRKSSFETKIMSNVAEYYTPAIEVRPRKYSGGISSIVNANIENFKKAMDKYGNIDIIHAHVSFPGGFVASKLSKMFGVPYVLTEHMGPFPFPFYLKNEKLSNNLKEAFEKASKVVAVSEFLKDEMFKFGIDTDAVIPDFVDDDFFVPDKSNIHDNKFIFFAASRITAAKGVEDMLYAFSMLCKKNKTAVLKIAGSGELKNMTTLAKTLNIENRVEWLGELDEVGILENLKICNAFISCSRYETFGVAVSEALSVGRPVISTKSGGVNDMLNDRNSLAVPVGDIEAIYLAMGKMIFISKEFDANFIRTDHIAKFGKKVVTERLRKLYCAAIGGAVCAP